MKTTLANDIASSNADQSPDVRRFGSVEELEIKLRKAISILKSCGLYGKYYDDIEYAAEGVRDIIRSLRAKIADPPHEIQYDFARCDGNWVEDGEDSCWQEGCETCLRRTAPRTEYCSMILPPKIIAFECENLIEP